MYPGEHARLRPDQPAVIMAGSGETLTYGELERRSNRLAHLLRANGLRRLDHFAVFMENNIRYAECCAAGERAGLYYTCVNSYLAPDEVAYIVNNSESKILITSRAKRAVALAALERCPNVRLCLIADGDGDGVFVRNLDEATTGIPDTPIADEALGIACSIPPAPPAGRRAFCVRCQTSRRPSTSRSTIFLRKHGVSAKARSTFNRRQFITRRRWQQSR